MNRRTHPTPPLALALPESPWISLFGGSCSTDTILLCNRRVTLRPDSGRHFVRYKENVPDGAVTHTFYRNANGVGINTKYCLLAVTSHSLLLGWMAIPVCHLTLRDVHGLSWQDPLVTVGRCFIKRGRQRMTASEKRWGSLSWLIFVHSCVHSHRWRCMSLLTSRFPLQS